MRDFPECMNRRYQALDELIAELTTVMSDQASLQKSGSDSNDASVKLMCEFWNILKEDPDCNLTEAVQQRMGLNPKSSRNFRPQRLACYMASKDSCCRDNSKNTKKPEPEQKGGCSSKSVSPKSSEMVPLSKVLCNLKEAVSFDKKCNVRISELMATQQELQEQIQQLEGREREGTQMLKQADCMWSCMEEAYKKKVAETLQRQNGLLKQVKEIETSNTKWRKNKKDLEFQLGNVNKCYEEIKVKLQEKTADVKCIKMEVDTFTKRAEANKKETAAVKKSFTNKKTASSARIASMSAEITRIKQKVYEEQAHKREKELEGSRHVKEAREDLQKIYRVLLQKKLENEDLKAEKEAIIQEIDLLRKTCDLCKDKCRIKHQTLIDEITKVDAEIGGYKAKCIKCHQCTDTGDTRKCCIDCPRCVEARECLYEDGHCTTDATMDCVCMSTKQKFIDNVFDNMYTVLERQAKTPPGKAVADAVLECLKRSRNGKLNDETKRILQDFVLTTVKKNLTLTIIGGAVKTRCEMDPETYQQLMLCLKQVKVAPPPKESKGTAPKKDPCSRWGGTSECNCPKGPKGCICGKKAPPPPNEPDTCPSSQDKDDAAQMLVCPHNKESAACGADCAMHAVPSAVGTEVAAWRPAPCSEKHCSFSKNMRAAQCFLGPDSLTSASKIKSHKSKLPHVPDLSVLKNQIICKCGPKPTNPCECRKELKCHPRERIIEEVMGRYTDVTPIEKVTTLDDSYCADLNMGGNKRICSNASVKEVLKLNISKSRKSQLCACSSSYISEDITPYKKTLQEKKLLYICRKRKDQGELNKEELYKKFPDFQFQSSKNVTLGMKSDEKIAILSCPLYTMQFVDRSVGSEENLLPTRQSSNKAIVPKGPTKLKEDDIKKRIQTFGVTRYVENIIKDVMILDTSMSRVNKKSSSVEWITVESFLKEISTLAHAKKYGSDTINNKMDRKLLSENNLKKLNQQTQTKQTLIKTYTKKIETCLASESDSISGSTICCYVCESFENSSLNSNENG